MEKLSSTAYSNLTMHPPLFRPRDGDVLLGYRKVSVQTSCCGICAKQKHPREMNQKGWFFTSLLCILFAPLALCPCLCTCSYDDHQEPVFGPPSMRKEYRIHIPDETESVMNLRQRKLNRSKQDYEHRKKLEHDFLEKVREDYEKEEKRLADKLDQSSDSY